MQARSSRHSPPLHVCTADSVASGPRGQGGTGPRRGWHWPAAGVALARGGVALARGGVALARGGVRSCGTHGANHHACSAVDRMRPGRCSRAGRAHAVVVPQAVQLRGSPDVRTVGVLVSEPDSPVPWYTRPGAMIHTARLRFTHALRTEMSTREFASSMAPPLLNSAATCKTAGTTAEDGRRLPCKATGRRCFRSNPCTRQRQGYRCARKSRRCSRSRCRRAATCHHSYLRRPRFRPGQSLSERKTQGPPCVRACVRACICVCWNACVLVCARGPGCLRACQSVCL